MLINPTNTTHYPFPAIRGVQMTRLPEQRIGPFRLDTATAETLVRENLGVFIGGCASVDAILSRLELLASIEYPGRWLIVLSCHELSMLALRHFAQSTGAQTGRDEPLVWTHGSAIFTIPEGLSHDLKFIDDGDAIAGVLLVDPPCRMHLDCGGGFRRRFTGYHDRPQYIANLRGTLQAEGRGAPLLLLTTRRARSTNTLRMLSPYSLDGWWFVDGATFMAGRPPQSNSQ